MAVASTFIDDRVDPRERRKAVMVAAAQDAATRGGYAAVTMRDVAQRAGVSTATLYRHFPSKQHLLVATLLDWLDRFDTDLDVAAQDIADPFGRLAFVIDLLHQTLSRTPRLAEAMARAYVAADASAASEVDIARIRMTEILAEAMGNGRPNSRQVAIGELLSDVWAANVLAVAHGRATAEAIRSRLRRTVHLLARQDRGHSGLASST